MTNSNSHTELSSISAGQSQTVHDQQLPDTYAELIASRAAIEAKLAEIETVAVPAMRQRWEQEAASIGKTVEDVLGIGTKKARGRRSSKSKRDE